MMLALGTGFPVSVTMPLMLPVVTPCANARGALAAIHRNMNHSASHVRAELLQAELIFFSN
jgi:hypothetical protein